MASLAGLVPIADGGGEPAARIKQRGAKVVLPVEVISRPRLGPRVFSAGRFSAEFKPLEAPPGRACFRQVQVPLPRRHQQIFKKLTLLPAVSREQTMSHTN